ncbi:MAG: NusA-like transcription termination signal-binding factor [Candidatus Woesearchaeota archaeon]
MRIKYGAKEIGYMSVFEGTTGAKAIDCIVIKDMAFFVVKSEEVSKAIGKGGENIHLLERLLRKRVKVAPLYDDVARFIKGLVSPLKIAQFRMEGNIAVITPPDLKTRGFLIGRAATNLRMLEAVVKRHFKIEEIKVE